MYYNLESMSKCYIIRGTVFIFEYIGNPSVSLKMMYNEIAGRYIVADKFGAISYSHHVAIEQIRKANLGMRPHYKVLDLGVGNGSFLQSLKRVIPKADFTGIDISTEMLKRARSALALTTIETNAADASHYLPHHSQDLVLAHFINAYIPIDRLFHEAHILTRSSGYFSLITTTYDSFPKAQQHLAEFIAEGTLMSNVVGHYYKSMVKNTTVASNQQVLLDTFKQHDFEIVAHERLEIPIIINSIDELAEFGIEGTWFLNSLSIKMLPRSFLIQRLKRLFEKIFQFPYQDTHVIDVILAKK